MKVLISVIRALSDFSPTGGALMALVLVFAIVLIIKMG